MIYTSYFARVKSMTPEEKSRCISIAKYNPKGLDIPVLEDLAPGHRILHEFKITNEVDQYIRSYLSQIKRTILRLGIDNLVSRLDNKILVCYEAPSRVCHRHFLAAYLTSKGYPCIEYGHSKYDYWLNNLDKFKEDYNL